MILRLEALVFSLFDVAGNGGQLPVQSSGPVVLLAPVRVGVIKGAESALGVSVACQPEESGDYQDEAQAAAATRA